MPYVTLIPGLLCAVVLWWRGTQSAFLNVFLPVLLLLPTNFFLEITHLPRLTFVDVTLLVLGAGMVVKQDFRWNFTWMDPVVLLFVFSCGYSEWTHYAAWRAGALAVMDGLVPYVAAKVLLADRTTEFETVKRFSTLAGIAFLVGSLEFVLKLNPYNWFWSHFYPGQWGGATTQLRWGFGRTSGPYTQSELAGIMVMAALVFSLWLARWYSTRRSRGRLAERSIWFAGPLAAGLLVAIYITQARGPWLGAVVALIFAAIGRAVKPMRRTVLVLVLIFTVALPFYIFVKQYTSGPRTDYGSEKETAQYRAELIDNYIPMAEEGGAWGLGRMVPVMHGQSSIDNEFLFLWLVQGYVGVGTFILILVATTGAFFRAGLAPTERLRSFITELPRGIDSVPSPVTGLVARFDREIERATRFTLDLNTRSKARTRPKSAAFANYWLAEPTDSAQRRQLVELRDRELYFSAVGILIGIAFTITTVWLGAQSFELLFLLAGWSQAVRLRPSAEAPEFQFAGHPLSPSDAMRVYT